MWQEGIKFQGDKAEKLEGQVARLTERNEELMGENKKWQEADSKAVADCLKEIDSLQGELSTGAEQVRVMREALLELRRGYQTHTIYDKDYVRALDKALALPLSHHTKRAVAVQEVIRVARVQKVMLPGAVGDALDKLTKIDGGHDGVK